MYPLDQDPYTWPTCDDAYDGSWRLDLWNYLDGFTGAWLRHAAIA